MKIFALITLILTGIIEITVGMLIGRVRIYGYELSFFRDLGLSPEHAGVFNHYIGIFKDQWQLVAWLGLITLVATVLLWRSIDTNSSS